MQIRIFVSSWWWGNWLICQVGPWKSNGRRREESTELTYWEIKSEEAGERKDNWHGRRGDGGNGYSWDRMKLRVALPALVLLQHRSEGTLQSTIHSCQPGSLSMQRSSGEPMTTRFLSSMNVSGCIWVLSSDDMKWEVRGPSVILSQGQSQWTVQSF